MVERLSSESLENRCRYCLEGDATERLVVPCSCTGYTRFVHNNCLTKWIKAEGAQRKECEICKAPFKSRSRLKPVSEWKLVGISSHGKRLLLLSIFCLLFGWIHCAWTLEKTDWQASSSQSNPMSFILSMVFAGMFSVGSTIVTVVKSYYYSTEWLKANSHFEYG